MDRLPNKFDNIQETSAPTGSIQEPAKKSIVLFTSKNPDRIFSEQNGRTKIKLCKERVKNCNFIVSPWVLISFVLTFYIRLKVTEAKTWEGFMRKRICLRRVSSSHPVVHREVCQWVSHTHSRESISQYMRRTCYGALLIIATDTNNNKQKVSKRKQTKIYTTTSNGHRDGAV